MGRAAAAIAGDLFSLSGEMVMFIFSQVFVSFMWASRQTGTAREMLIPIQVGNKGNIEGKTILDQFTTLSTTVSNRQHEQQHRGDRTSEDYFEGQR